MNNELTRIKNLLAIQGSQGNWNYDPYMHGMYNGMELCVAILEDREPVYKTAPKEWLSDKRAKYSEFEIFVGE